MSISLILVNKQGIETCVWFYQYCICCTASQMIAWNFSWKYVWPVLYLKKNRLFSIYYPPVWNLEKISNSLSKKPFN